MEDVEKEGPVFKYVHVCAGQVLPANAIKASYDDEKAYYHARGTLDNGLVILGKGVVTSDTLKIEDGFFSYMNKEHRLSKYQVLTTKLKVGYVKCSPGDTPPEGAIIGGDDHGKSYYARAEVERGVIHPGKVGIPNKDTLILKSASIPYQDKEVRLKNFEVLVIEEAIDKVEYIVDKKKISKAQPKSIAQITVNNTSAKDQKVAFSFSESVSTKSMFIHKAGVELKVGTKFEAGLPLIGKAETSIEITGRYDLTWGTEETKTQKFANTFDVTAGPGETVKCSADVKQCVLDVPYIITFKSGRTSTGIWTGTSVSSLTANYTKVKS